MTNDENIEWMKEHLSYERMMLRHTIQRMTATWDQLDYNCYYEAFAIHARNLYDFVTDDAGSTNIEASDFAPGFKATPYKERQAVHKLLEALNYQVFHMGKRRPWDVPEKVDLDDCKAVVSWIEKEMVRFAAEKSLAAEYAAVWAEITAAESDAQRSVEPGTLMLTVAPKKPSQSSHPTSSKSVARNPTHTASESGRMIDMSDLSKKLNNR